MANDIVSGHIVRSYDHELSRLRALVLEMGAYVLEQQEHAVAALTGSDLNLARKVIDKGRKVDYFELDVDDAVFNLIAKRQPAAIDLRLILGLSKVAGDLERAGDKAEQIGWCTVRLLERGNQPAPRVMHHVRRLHELSHQMLRLGVDALAAVDVDQALEVFVRDREVEEEFDAAMRHLMTFVFEDVSLLGQVLDLGLGLRALHSIADHAGNIAEQVIFIVRGKDVRYQNREILVEALRQRSTR